MCVYNINIYIYMYILQAIFVLLCIGMPPLPVTVANVGTKLNWLPVLLGRGASQHVYICIYMHTHTYIYIFIHIHGYKYIYIYTCVKHTLTFFHRGFTSIILALPEITIKVGIKLSR